MLDFKTVIPWGHKHKGSPAVLDLLEDPFSALRQDIDREFDDFFHGDRLPSLIDDGLARSCRVNPRLDVYEIEKNIVIIAELPGVELKDIDVTLSDDVLAIRGEIRCDLKNHDSDHHYMERRYGSFLRELRLPFWPDDEDISVELKSGLLTLIITKHGAIEDKATHIDVRES